MLRKSLILLAVFAAAGQCAVQLTVDVSEAEQALAILRHRDHVTEADWQALFATIPYQQLKAREASMGRGFADAEFRTFLLSDEAQAKKQEWETALAAFKQADLQGIAVRTLEWLPAGASIQARVFPLVKPRTNSFVWGAPEPGIFLYLSQNTGSQFENTVAHECHHIGLNTLPTKGLKWLGAFGEGIAMLAAAGSIDRHPHAGDDAVTRARWDGDMMHFNADVSALEMFFEEVLEGKFKDDSAVMARAAPFWGDAQGPWYTVGYEMAVLVERRFGRKALLECMTDPRQLLVLYNRVAGEANAAAGARLAIWSPALLERLASVNSPSN